MGRIEEHLDQWKHNRDFLATIPTKFSDWIVTVCLYSALHAIEALLTADGVKARNRHQDRLEILQSEHRYQKIYQNFRVLYDLGHVTRYSAKPARWIPSEQIKKQVIDGLLVPIENSVRKLLATSKPSIPMPPHVSADSIAAEDSPS